MLVLALIKSVEIIGEAGASVSREGREATPDVPWPEIVGMRNRLVHAYFDVNLDVVWTTVRHDLPPLVTALQGALEKRIRISKPKSCHNAAWESLAGGFGR